MKVLFIGGTGIISSACSEHALSKGIELYHFNRGQSHRKIAGAILLKGDIRNIAQAAEVLKDYSFDVVVDWIAFVPEHIKSDIELFRNKTKQFVFISSASAYQKPVNRLPITEETPLDNPYWQYSRDKIACEKLLLDEYKNNGFPATIVRPSHTYDKTLIPVDWGYTVLDRMKKGKKTVIHDDGNSLWVLTHHKDFAVGFTGLLGHPKAIGEAFHITGSELMTWNQIYELLSKAMGVVLDPVYIPSSTIHKYDPRMGDSLLGDKAHTVIFDNTKIKKLVPDFKQTIPFEEGVRDIVSFYEKNPDFQKVNPELDSLIDKMIALTA